MPNLSTSDDRSQDPDMSNEGKAVLFVLFAAMSFGLGIAFLNAGEILNRTELITPAVEAGLLIGLISGIVLGSIMGLLRGSSSSN